jgi:nitrogen fixation/metabolism regulation signal transduction histidine kinase
LGLPIAKAIIEEHGGRLEIGDAEGGGARVQLRLPDTLNAAEGNNAAQDNQPSDAATS